MTSSDTVALIATGISICALVFTFLNYQRDRNKSNQDFIFQEKIALYKELVLRANNILEEYYILIDQLQNFKGSEKEWIKFHEKQYDHYDKLVVKFYNPLFESMPVLPKKVYNEMWDFGQGAAHFLTSAFNGNAKLTITAYDRLESSLIKNIDLVREDLRVDKLNISLLNRLK